MNEAAMTAARACLEAINSGVVSLYRVEEVARIIEEYAARAVAAERQRCAEIIHAYPR